MIYHLAAYGKAHRKLHHPACAGLIGNPKLMRSMRSYGIKARSSEQFGLAATS